MAQGARLHVAAMKFVMETVSGLRSTHLLVALQEDQDLEPLLGEEALFEV